jgi:hypothetical protein
MVLNRVGLLTAMGPAKGGGDENMLGTEGLAGSTPRGIAGLLFAFTRR